MTGNTQQNRSCVPFSCVLVLFKELCETLIGVCMLHYNLPGSQGKTAVEIAPFDFRDRKSKGYC